MSTLSVTGDLADTLKSLQAAPHVSLLLGAGASAAADLPLWGPMVERLLVASGAVDTPEAAAGLLARQDPLLAAEAALAKRSDPERSRLLYRALYGTADPDEAAAEFTSAALHDTVADLVAESPNKFELLTLNVDDLLEEAVGSRGLSYYSRSSASPREAPGAITIHHLHGFLPRADPEGGNALVFTLSDYTGLVGNVDAWQRVELNLRLQQGPLLLVSTSYNDMDVRTWLGAIALHHPVYVLVPRQTLRLDPAQFELVKPALEAQWAQIGVTALLVDDYADIAQLLRELSHAGNPDYLSPSERIGRLWTVHEREFTTLQEEDSATLAADLDTLAPTVGDDANLTLWLADGSGRLVRWSSPDRQYVASDRLRRIEARHDSPWLAAQAFCQDAEVVNVRIRAGSDPLTETRRWRSVAAIGVRATLPGGPTTPVGVLSSASVQDFTGDVDAWTDALRGLADDWATRLAARA
ncbi:SIR2 family protein [Blastococcus sp. PRF04-17]|uniref:SIR2 family protein n=1 Tax=Blastococcus sp. PRF04-17 TaxID=2933797 RepID=UPI001FF6F0EB|nr:SIR2 family protein [Blastococcus sp. PRF04-17]UOY02456.1 SIR2 family protein [Blastococcus sp. PRF04-17]